MRCDRCYGLLDVGEHGLYLCPLAPRRAAAVVPDDIPGGLVIEHGLCNDDGTPRTYYSRTEIDRACEAKGMRRWSDYYSEDRTKPAREYGDWLKSGDAQRQMRQNQERERETQHVRARAQQERRR